MAGTLAVVRPGTVLRVCQRSNRKRVCRAYTGSAGRERGTLNTQGQVRQSPSAPRPILPTSENRPLKALYRRIPAIQVITSRGFSMSRQHQNDDSQKKQVQDDSGKLSESKIDQADLGATISSAHQNMDFSRSVWDIFRTWALLRTLRKGVILGYPFEDEEFLEGASYTYSRLVESTAAIYRWEALEEHAKLQQQQQGSVADGPSAFASRSSLQRESDTTESQDSHGHERTNAQVDDTPTAEHTSNGSADEEVIVPKTGHDAPTEDDPPVEDVLPVDEHYDYLDTNITSELRDTILQRLEFHKESIAKGIGIAFCSDCEILSSEIWRAWREVDHEKAEFIMALEVKFSAKKTYTAILDDGTEVQDTAVQDGSIELKTIVFRVPDGLGNVQSFMQNPQFLEPDWKIASFVM
eukprot:m.1266718 g.1266718  ORF g.1266718 m.1266718 type:complete len:410 (+) comp24741_c0_seq34:220-1449(+)